MSAQYDLILNRNENFTLYLEYLDETGKVVDLVGNTASDPLYYVKMMIKPYRNDNQAVVLLKSNPFEVLCGTTQDGISGGIKLNRNFGNTGGYTGGIFITLNPLVSMTMSPGKSFYDIFLVGKTGDNKGYSTKLLEGSVDVVKEITTNIEDQFRAFSFNDEIDGGAFT